MYSGDFGFDSGDEGDAQQRPLATIAAATIAAARSPPPAQPLDVGGASPPAGPPDGPRPMLYIRSERLAQLSRQLPVNADRPQLVHSLIDSYGLLEASARLLAIAFVPAAFLFFPGCDSCADLVPACARPVDERRARRWRRRRRPAPRSC